MVTTAYLKLWGERIGAVAWDEKQELAFFEYEKKFIRKGYNLSPIKMPLKNEIYSFPELRSTLTFKGLPGLLADTLPDKYGNELIYGLHVKVVLKIRLTP